MSKSLSVKDLGAAGGNQADTLSDLIATAEEIAALPIVASGSPHDFRKKRGWDVERHRRSAQYQAGLNRSSLIATRALMLDGMSADEAIKLIRAKRSPACLCNPAFESHLRGIDLQPSNPETNSRQADNRSEVAR